MSAYYTTKPEYVDASGSLVEFQKDRLLKYATKLGEGLFETYEKTQQLRIMNFAHVQQSVAFPNAPKEEIVDFVFEVYGNPNTYKVDFIECFVKVGSWIFMRFELRKEHSDDNADGKKESIQSQLSVHDESSDQRV